MYVLTLSMMGVGVACLVMGAACLWCPGENRVNTVHENHNQPHRGADPNNPNDYIKGAQPRSPACTHWRPITPVS